MLTGYPEFLLMRHTRVSGTAAWYRVRATWKFLVFVRRLQATRVFSRGSVWIYQNFQEWHQRPSWGVKIRMLMRRARQSPRGWSNNTSCHCTRFLFFFATVEIFTRFWQAPSSPPVFVCCDHFPLLIVQNTWQAQAPQSGLSKQQHGHLRVLMAVC